MNPSQDSILQADRAALVSRTGLVGVILIIACGALALTGFFDLQRFAEGMPALGQLFSEMMPPDFSRWRDWLNPLLDTLAMSIAGTALAVVISLPLGLLAAPNISPHPVILLAARTLLAFLRSVPELIMGILFVAAVGFGALPGVLALGLHSVGMVGKFYAEAIEHADPRPIGNITFALPPCSALLARGALAFSLSRRCACWTTRRFRPFCWLFWPAYWWWMPWVRR